MSQPSRWTDRRPTHARARATAPPAVTARTNAHNFTFRRHTTLTTLSARRLEKPVEHAAATLSS